jgi:uncharacterized delta-60 repeat protein
LLTLKNLSRRTAMNRSYKLHALAAVFVATLAACGGGSSDPAASPTPEPGTDAPAPPPPPPPAEFTLSLSTEKAVILQGSSVTVKASITRSAGFSDAVQVALSGLPSGVSAPVVTIAAGATEADVVLSAQAAAPHSLPTASTAQGTAGTVSASHGLTVTVRGLPGAVDTSFGGGIVTTPVDIGEDYANAVAVQDDGKVIVAGSSATATGTWVSLVRYQRDGSIDTSFGNSGKVITPVGSKGNDSARAVAVQSDGKIVVAGSSEQAGTGLDFALLRYNANGTLDTSFGNGGKVVTDFGGDSDRAWALLIQADNKIVVGGEANFGSATTGVDFALARYNADGSLDAGFGNGGKVTTPLKSNAGTDVVRALALQTVDGEARILAVGGEGDFLAARYSASGTLDASFAGSGKIVGLFNASIGGARAVTVLPSGEAVLAGHIDHRFAAVRLTAAGALDNGFGTGGKFTHAVVDNWNEATAMVRQADGKLILGGWIYTGNSSSGDFAALRLEADGTLDAGFGTGGIVVTPTAAGTKNDLGKALVLQADDRVPTVRAIQAGEANGSNHDFVVLRYWL